MKRMSALLALFSLTGCMVGPDYQRPPPASDPTPAYKEVEGEVNGVNFRPALPRDTIDRGPWWTIYNDPTLDHLMAQVDVSNQTLKEDEAAYRQAVALIRQAQSSLYPTLGYTGSLTQSSSSTGIRSSGGGVSNSVGVYALGGTVSWEIDVWGSIRRTIESNAAAAQASAATLDAARLSVQSSLATAYFSLRIADEATDFYRRSVAAYERALAITRNQVNAGTASGLDEAEAETILEQTRALYVAEGAIRAQFEHSIAALIGKMPSEVSVETAILPRKVPTLDAGVPSALLERRPDVASAERTMQSANALIGVAQAAYYPSFTFDASISFLSTTLGNLLKIASSVWSLGPGFAGTLVDGGARAAQVESARATYDKDVATYRQTVITAFQQVEDALAQQRYYQLQEEIQRRAVAAANRAVDLSLNQYQAGTVAYTTVITNQTAALNDEQTLLSIRLNRYTASSTLIAALGGGWREQDIPPLIPVAPKSVPKPSPVKKSWWPF